MFFEMESYSVRFSNDYLASIVYNLFNHAHICSKYNTYAGNTSRKVKSRDGETASWPRIHLFFPQSRAQFPATMNYMQFPPQNHLQFLHPTSCSELHRCLYSYMHIPTQIPKNTRIISKNIFLKKSNYHTTVEKVMF